MVLAGEVIAESRHALRVLEPDRPPVYYFPPGDYRRACLRRTANETFCELKGVAQPLRRGRAGGARRAQAAWSYPNPAMRYAVLRDYVGVDPGRVDAC